MANVRSLINQRILVKYTSDVPPITMMASSLLSAINCRARSILCWRSSTVMGDASERRDFNLAIGAGSVLDVSPCANDVLGCASATVAAIPALCRKFRRVTGFIKGSLGDWIE